MEDDEFEEVGSAQSLLDELAGLGDVEPGDGGRKRSVVGYLRGRGGRKTADPAGALSVLRGEIREIAVGLTELLAEAERVEEAFLHVRRAFERVQPPMYGRMAVRWWLVNRTGRRVPCLIQVRGDGQGREKPVRVMDRRVRRRTDGGYGLNADLAKEVFEVYWALWALRCSVQEDLSRLAQVLRGRRKKVGQVDRLAWDSVRLRAEATDRLRRVGFSFDAEGVPEWPLPEGFWGEGGEAAKVLSAKAGEDEWREVGIEPEGGSGEG